MNEQTPDVVEQEFFTALIEANVSLLDEILASDFLMIDALTGSEVPKSALLDAVRGGQLRFDEIDRIEYRARIYEGAAIVTGRTQMKGSYAGEAFGASSRYTHVFINQDGQWRMVAAQGTQVAPLPAAG